MTGPITNGGSQDFPSRRRFLLALTGGAALLAVPRSTLAAPRLEADPDKVYTITPDVGPWVICAASYTGPTAQELSRQVVLSLRRRDNLPAYVYNWGEERRQQQAEANRLMKEKNPDYRARVIHYEDECGILIGGYPTMDAAREVLRDVKKLKMPEVSLGPNQTVNQIIQTPSGDGYQLYEVSPFINCFVSRNPTVPRDQGQEKKDDPFLKELNAEEEFSLLNCPAPCTLLIKSYVGASSVQSTTSGSSPFLNSLKGNSDGKMLSAAGINAHNLAMVLRQIRPGYDAYVLHTRHASHVTVGGFKGPDDERLAQVRQLLIADSRLLVDGAGRLNYMQLANFTPDANGNATEQLAGLRQQFATQLMPMRVPRP